MSRTDLDAVTLASSLRMKAGDGSVEWVYEPIQASVLLDIADMLDDNANLRERITTQKQTIQSYRDESREWREAAEHAQAENAKLTKLARWMYQVMDESCAVHYPYEPAPVSMQALMRAEKELQTLGIGGSR